MRRLIHMLCLLLSPGLLLGQGHMRIINGSAAKPKQLPYQVVLHVYFGNSDDAPSLCGGTIISRRWILTAAHCLQDPDTHLVKAIVTAGVLNKSNKTEPGFVEMVVEKNDTIVHPQYDRDMAINDIALIRLPKELKLLGYVRAAKLPRPRFRTSGRSAIVSGWGLTAKEQPSDKLQYVRVKIITNRQCKREWNAQLQGESKLLPDTVLCINSKGGLPCHGDSGGPLVLDDGSLILVGIVSHGYDEKCQIRLPDIFTRVSAFIDWIAQQTGIQSKT